MKRKLSLLLIVVALTCGVLFSCKSPEPSNGNISLDNIPDFSDKAYVVINGNVPSFTDEEKSSTKSYEFFSELDSLGRCGYTMACIGTDLMPTEDRGSIGQVKPSGWQTVRYDIVDAKYLYNRCHLIGFQLTGENANVKNLITGTRYLNIEGMLPFENMVADYLKENPENHVLYRCTPIFEKYNLVASGVHMEGYSIEDGGEGVSFNVYAYNAQPGVVINYANGMSRLATEEEWNGKLPSDTTTPTPDKPSEVDLFKLNTESKKIHTEECRYSENLSEECKGSELGLYKAKGYTLCGICDPMPDEVWEQIILACISCIDKNDDGKCDVCATDFSDGCDAEHTDANDDGKCDFGGEDFDDGEEKFYLNTSTKKLHLKSCRYASGLTDTCSRAEFAICKAQGYTPCGTCKPISQEEWDSLTTLCNEHRDENDDGTCDFCKEAFTDACDVQACRDENDDNRCDACSHDFSDGCDAEHIDDDDDGKCDFGGEDFTSAEETVSTYVINTDSKKIHKSTCRYAKSPDGIKYVEFVGTESELHEAYPEEDGYTACGTCKTFD